MGKWTTSGANGVSLGLGCGQIQGNIQETSSCGPGVIIMGRVKPDVQIRSGDVPVRHQARQGQNCLTVQVVCGPDDG